MCQCNCAAEEEAAFGRTAQGKPVDNFHAVKRSNPEYAGQDTCAAPPRPLIEPIGSLNSALDETFMLVSDLTRKLDPLTVRKPEDQCKEGTPNRPVETEYEDKMALLLNRVHVLNGNLAEILKSTRI